MIKKLIAHQVIKSAHNTETRIKTREELLPSTELSESLFGLLSQSFRSHNPTAGKFEDIGQTKPPFQQLLLDCYQKEEPGNEGFTQFTKTSMDLFKGVIEKQPLATGGYLVFVEYEASGKNFLLIALLGSEAQPSFNDDLELVETVTLDFKDLRHAARIRTSEVSSNDDGVVQFISKKSGNVSGYFVEFIGCEKIQNSNAQGIILHGALKSWCADHNCTPEQKSGIMGATYGYWKECVQNKAQMTLSGLANRIYPDDSKSFLDYLSDEDRNLAGTIDPPAPHIMKNLIRFSFDRGGIKIEYNRDIWNDKVTVDLATNSVRITGISDKHLKEFLEEQ